MYLTKKYLTTAIMLVMYMMFCSTGPMATFYSSVSVCPPGWQRNTDRCYNFVFYPHLPYDDASLECQVSCGCLNLYFGLPPPPIIFLDDLIVHHLIRNYIMAA